MSRTAVSRLPLAVLVAVAVAVAVAVPAVPAAAVGTGARTSAPAQPVVAASVTGPVYSRAVPTPARRTCLPTDCVDATEHGANGTDDLPDSVALRAAAVAAAQARRTLWLPAGTYRLTSPLAIPTGLKVAGAGIDRTVLKIDWPSLLKGQFGHGYAITSWIAGSNPPQRSTKVTVQDLTVHGSRDESGCVHGVSNAACPENQGGGISTGDGWTVRQVRLTNLNYFKLGVFEVDNVVLAHNRFDNDEPGFNSSGDEDNIGGGQSATNIVIEGNRWAPSAVGNAIDLTAANNVVTRNNATFGPSLIYEGVRGGRIENNYVTGHRAGINLKSNAHYAASVARFGLRHTTGVVVSGNRVVDVESNGIVLGYFPTRTCTANIIGGLPCGDPDTVDPATVSPPTRGNSVRGNTIVRAKGVGIYAYATNGAQLLHGDRIDGNTITDVSWRDSGQAEAAFTVPVGIGVTGAAGTVIGTNTVRDTRAGAPVTDGTLMRAAQPPTGPHTASAVVVGAATVTPQTHPRVAVTAVAPQASWNVWSTPVHWNTAVPTAVTRPDERGGTVTVTGYGLGLVDRRSPGGVSVGGLAATSLSAASPPDPATGLSTMTATVASGTGSVPLTLRTADRRLSGVTVAARYGPAVDATVAEGTVVPATGGSIRVSTSLAVGAGPAEFSRLRITGTVGAVRARVAWAGPNSVVVTSGRLTPGSAAVVLSRDGVAGRPSGPLRVAAVVTQLDRRSGPAGGGTVVHVSGLGLSGAGGWRFGDRPAVCATVSVSTVRCSAPAGTAGTAVQVQFDPADGVALVDSPAARWSWRSS